MALGTMGAMMASSAVGGLASMSAANKAADAQTKAADKTAETQRYIFDKSTSLTAPFRGVGLNALNALAYELGVGSMPTPQDYSITTKTIPGAPATYSGGVTGGTITPGADGSWTWGYDRGGESAGTTQNALTSAGTPDVTKYYVGDREFDSRNLAQDWIDQQPSGVYTGFKETPGYKFRLGQGLGAIENMASARGMRLSGNTLKSAGDYADGMASQEHGNYMNRLMGLTGTGQSSTSQQISAGQNYANNVSNAYTQAGNARASGYINQANALNSTLGDMSGLYTMGKMGVWG